MDDLRKAKIDELKTRIVQWERVHQYEVGEIRDDNSRFKQTLKTAGLLLGVGSIPSFLRIAYWSFFETPDAIGIGPLALTVFATFVLVVTAAAAARVSGLLAHFWFRRDASRQQLAVYFISLAAAASILGWVFVLTW